MAAISLPFPMASLRTLVPRLLVALLAVVLEHREANASVMKFFYDLFRAGRTREQDLDFEVRVGY